MYWCYFDFLKLELKSRSLKVNKHYLDNSLSTSESSSLINICNGKTESYFIATIVLFFPLSSLVVIKLKFDENSSVVIVLGVNFCVFLCRNS